MHQLENCSIVKDVTTITVRLDVKDRLAQAKGGRSWDEFLSEVADRYLDEAIALAERRLEELRAHKARTLGLDEVDALRETVHERKAGPVGRARARGRGEGAGGASR